MTVYAERPWNLTSRSVVAASRDSAAPIFIDGIVFEYFLECSIINELRESMPDADQSLFCTTVIRYAETDA